MFAIEILVKETPTSSGNQGGKDEEKAFNSAPSTDLPDVDGYSLGVQLNVPIYSGGAIQSSVRKAQQNFVLASQNLGGWLLKPIKDADGNVTGTHMMFANAASVGGIIPDAVTNSQVPKSVAAMTQGTIAWVRKNKGS